MRWPKWIYSVAAALPLLFSGELPADPLRVLTEELPPLNFTANGKLSGLSVEVVREIMRRTGDPDTIQSVPWARGYRAALEEPNVVLFSTTRTEEREELFQWVGPLVEWSFVFYKKRGSPIALQHLDDARQVGSIATYRDDVREQFLKEKGFTNLDSSPKLISCARKLLEGRVDLWLDSNLSARQIVSQIGHDPKDIEPVLTVKTNHLYIAFSKQTDSAKVKQWQATLNEMSRDGTFQRIYKRWLPDETPPEMGLLSPGQMRQWQTQLRLLTEELPPINYSESGEVKGQAVDIVREIMRRLDLSLDITVMPWSRAYNTALNETHVALFSTVRTPERENQFKWVGKLGSNETVLYGRRGDSLRIESIEDARAVESIGTYKDDVDEQYLKSKGFSNLYSHGSPVSAVRNLMNRRVQLWVGGSLYAPQVIRRAGFSPEDIEPRFTLRGTSFYIAFSRDTPDAVVDLWQSVLDTMYRDGTMTALKARWKSHTSGTAAQH